MSELMKRQEEFREQKAKDAFRTINGDTAFPRAFKDGFDAFKSSPLFFEMKKVIEDLSSEHDGHMFAMSGRQWGKLNMFNLQKRAHEILKELNHDK